MKKWLGLIMTVLSLALPGVAQTIPATGTLTASDTGACSTTGACLVVTLKQGMASSVVQVTGTFSATLQFEASTSVGGTFVAINGTPSNSTSAVTSVTAVGAWRIGVSGYSQIRVRCSTFASGSAAVAITSSTGSSAAISTGNAQVALLLGGNAAQGSALSANQIGGTTFVIPYAVTFGNITVNVGTLDASASDWYAWGIYDLTGSIQCGVGAVNLTATGAVKAACKQGSITLQPGVYWLCFSGSAGVARLNANGGLTAFSSALSATASALTGSAVALPNTITMPTAGQVTTSLANMAAILN